MKVKLTELDDTDPEQEKWAESAAAARQTWRHLGLRLKSTTPASVVRLALILSALGSIAWLVWGTWPALLPFLIGSVVAYALLPFTNWLDRFMPRVFAVTLALLTLLALLGLVVYAGVTVLGRQAFFVYQNLPHQEEVDLLIGQVNDSLTGLPAPLRDAINEILTQLSARLRNNLETYNAQLVELVFSGVLSLLNTLGFILGFLAVPAWLLLVLRDQQAGARALQRLLPSAWMPDILAVWRIFDRSFRAFVEGLLVLALFVTIFVYAGLLLLDSLDLLNTTFKFGAASFAGLMQLVPTVGPIIVILMILLTRLTLFNTTEMLILLGLYLAVEQLLRMTAERRVRKQVAAGVHPALLIIVIVALSGLGFLWVFLAAPVTTVLRDLFLYVYGRFSEPPRPAGLLPGEPLPKTKPSRSPVPNRRLSSPQLPLAYRHGRAAKADRRPQRPE